MPFKRVNCVQRLMNNQTCCVNEFLTHLTKFHPFDLYVVVPFTSLPRFIRRAQNEDKDMLPKMKNISSIPTSHINPSTNSHQHSWIQNVTD